MCGAFSQVLALQPNNRQAHDELRALRDIPDDLDADLAGNGGPPMDDFYHV